MKYLKGIELAPNARSLTGVLMVNLGTPQAATPKAVRTYLAEFLSDQRVVELPRWLWKIILHGIVLRTRPRRSAENYQRIWTPQGSPLMMIGEQQVKKLRHQFLLAGHEDIKVVLAMRYGKPSIAEGLEKLRQAGMTSLVVLPLYPQYASATTGSIFEAVMDILKTWRVMPNVRLIREYYQQPSYIQALVDSIQQHWEIKGRADRLLFSFHGLPKRSALQNDPYALQCQSTAKLVADALNLDAAEWQCVYQSRFGAQEWLQPYCDKTLKQLPKQGVKSVDIICPGFAADCLETLDEIARENKDIFLKAGGERYEYIKALNASTSHAQAWFDAVQGA